MKYTHLLQSMLVVGGLSLGASALAATPSAEMLGNTCAGGHGTDGSSHGPATPSIAGISSEYFIDAMKAYKDGSRPATIMTRIAKGYSEEEIKLMAGFFAGKKMQRIDQPHDAKLAKSGAKLHEKYCEKCHEDGGRSSEDDAGILAGQMAPYLTYTLNDMRSGARDMPKKMKKKVEELDAKYGDKGVNALINYYASQK